MPIMARTLFRDMLYFFRNQSFSIIILSILTAIISVVLGHVLSPGNEQLMTLIDVAHVAENNELNQKQLIEQMSNDQRRVLFKAYAASTVSSLICNVFLSGGMLAIIRLVSNRELVKFLPVLSLLALLLPRLLFLMVLTTLLVQLGLLLMIVPGILLAIAFILAPIISTNDSLGPLQSMFLSANLAFSNLRLLSPAVFFWLLAKAGILLLATKLTLLSSLAVTVLLNSLSNLISALFLLYLYRLYMFLREPK
ncbi:YciC family protein [secondary endosymbiont of Ctenarytaina eucalypti]|uniref:UPF0259 membrane protein A359_05730 n=1 Tax=secondary endosymbiont of Ctenarytaina eucalypti TaxID=1199245 RepID=J3TXM2_9ENTR|nr:YciC family protein [secondary endosymbiont of Ctenarytaina eucalypti]AFP84965.1 Uncharacterized protein family (UPF0259) [secondary endosymbiont of Ctenarytaina eucalypti]